MDNLTARRCDCNRQLPHFPGICENSARKPRFWPGFTASAPPKPASGRQKPALTTTAARVLDAIRDSADDGAGQVRLLQTELAQRLGVNPVTVRRAARKLQELGILIVRRGKNCMNYFITRMAAAPPPAPTPQAPPVAAAPPPQNIPAPETAAIADATPPTRAEAGATPRCPKHKRSRISWMSTPTEHTLYHCPVRTAFGEYCSWLHSPELGELNPPGANELDLAAVQERLNPHNDAAAGFPPPSVAATTTPPQPPPAPVINAPAQALWERLSAALRAIAPHLEPRPDILTQCRAASYDGETLAIHVNHPSLLRYLNESMDMTFMPQAIRQTLGREIAIQYLYPGDAR